MIAPILTAEVKRQMGERQKRARGEGRVWKRKGGGFTIAYYVNGNEVVKSAAKELGKRPKDTTYADAARLLRRRLGEIENGSIQTAADNKATVLALLNGYLEAMRVRKNARRPGRGDRAVKNYQSDVEHLRPLHGLRAAALTTTEITTCTGSMRRAGLSPGTCNHTLGLLSAAYRWGLRTEQLTRKPFIVRFDVSNARSGFFEREELDLLLGAIKRDVVADLVRFLAAIGCRLGEALALQWHSIDRRAGTVRFNDTKNGTDRVVNIEELPEAQELLSSRAQERRITTEHGDRLALHVFHVDGKALTDTIVYDAWWKACKAVGFWLEPDAKHKKGRPTKILHDLRRTFARDARNAGMSEGVIMEICGWRSRTMFMRYAINSPDDQRHGFAKLTAYRRGADVLSFAERAATAGGTRTKSRTVRGK